MTLLLLNFLRYQDKFSSENWASLSKSLQFFAKLDPESDVCLYATDIIKCASDLNRIHEIKPSGKIEMLKNIESIPENILTEFQTAGIDIISLRNYLRFYLAKQNIAVEHNTIKDNI